MIWFNETTVWNIAALLAFLLFLGWESIQPFPFFRGETGRRYLHLARNIGFALLNAALIGICFLILWKLAAGRSVEIKFGLLHRFALPIWLHTFLAIMLLDIWTYWWHRANHRILFLWRFHRMHHSDPWMDVSSARRFHPGEIIFSSILPIPLVFLLGLYLWELLLYGWLMGFVVDFHHANIALPERFDRWLRIFLVTPAMHKVHHSRIQIETDSNYTSLLSVWDRIFNSFRRRTDLAAIEIGLGKYSLPRFQTLRGMMTTPFSRNKSYK